MRTGAVEAAVSASAFVFVRPAQDKMAALGTDNPVTESVSRVEENGFM